MVSGPGGVGPKKPLPSFPWEQMLILGTSEMWEPESVAPK